MKAPGSTCSSPFHNQVEGRASGLARRPFWDRHADGGRIVNTARKRATFNVYLQRVEGREGRSLHRLTMRRLPFECSGTVLVVEIRRTSEGWSAICCSDLGFEVLAAADGKEALQIIESSSDSIRLCSPT
jgi:hypothetical protein